MRKLHPVIILGICTLINACTTVSILSDSKKTRISIPPQQSAFYQAIDNYTRVVKDSGWTGEDPLIALAQNMLAEKDEKAIAPKTYLNLLQKDLQSIDAIVEQIAIDIHESRSGLAVINQAAQGLLLQTTPTHIQREALKRFEVTLVLAQKTRQSFSLALKDLEPGIKNGMNPAAMLKADEALLNLSQTIENTRQLVEEMSGICCRPNLVLG